MTTTIQALLARLEEQVIAQEVPAAQSLGPPVAAGEVQERLSQLGLRAPEELLAVYNWHNGYSDYAGNLAESPLTPRGLRLLSLDQALAFYEQWLGPRAEVAEVAAPNWFPVFGREGPRYVIIRCDGPSDAPAPVSTWDAWYSMSDFTPVPTLAEPLNWWLEYLETGQWRWGGEHWIDDVDPSTLSKKQLHSGLA